MTSNLLELSKQGNPQAIAALMNRQLQPKGITARVLLHDRCLKVMLDAGTVPNQEALAPFVRRGVTSLQIPAVQTIQVYGRKSGEKAPAWTQAFQVDCPEPLISEPAASDDHQPPADTPAPPLNAAALMQGDGTTALETALNQFVNDQDIAVIVEQTGTILKVTAKTDKFLEGPSFAKGIYQELQRLDCAGVETVEVYKQKRKGSYSFRIQSFTLTKQETPAPVVETPAAPEPKTATAKSSRVQPLNASPRSSTPVTPKKPNINGFRRKLTIAFAAVASVFVVIRLINRLAFAFSSPMGWFGIVIALFALWRAWSFFGPLLQQLLREE